MVVPKTRSSIQVVDDGDTKVRSDIAIPRLRPDYMISETKAFALNPTDRGHRGPVIGCDWSGIVLEIGENVTRFKPGDTVYGTCHGGNTVEPDDGAFSDIITNKEQTTMHKPDFLSFEEAASLGVGLITVGQSLYFTMKLPLPSPVIPPNLGPVLLVYGGSSATGSLAIQAAKLSGFRVYTTCSPSSAKLVESRGVEKWFDYNQPDLVDQIKATGVEIPYILDCLGTDQSGTFCGGILSPKGGHYHSITLKSPEFFKKVRPEDSAVATTALGYAMLGERFEFKGGKEFPADPEVDAFAKKWATIAENLVSTRQIKPHPVEIR